jgi:hypothetical protein
MDSNPSPIPSAIVAVASAVMVGLIVLAKPWLIGHLAIHPLSTYYRLVFGLAVIPVCAVCIVVFRILNRLKN